MVKDSGVRRRAPGCQRWSDVESTLTDRLGLERLDDQTLELGLRPGAAKPGRKVCSLVHAMALGADSIDDCDLLRAGGTERCLDTA